MAINAGPSKHWIAGAIKNPGSFTRQAQSAGMSVPAFAQKKKHAKGQIGRRARLAQTLENLHK